MTAFLKKIYMAFIGLLAGIAAWTLVEILLLYGEVIPGHLFWNGLTGAAMGLIFGFVFGSADGIMFSNMKKSLKEGLIGSGLGLLGGAAGVILAQGVLYSIGNAELFTSSVTDSTIIPLARAFGWSLLGSVIGSVDGIKGRSLRRTRIGISGGAIGGVLGGLLLEFLTRFWPLGFFARGVSIALMGTMIGLFYTLFEYSQAYGRLRILNGSIRGREYLLLMKKSGIGSHPGSPICLTGYKDVQKYHAELAVNRGSVIVREQNGKVLVNDDPVSEQELKFEDVIQIGDAKLFYLPIHS